MQDTLAIILGGGRGERLFPLTKMRAKPALPLAGNYRLIDIPVSNCINSDVRKIFILTQFNSASLNRHVSTTYSFSPFMKGFVEILAAQQTTESPEWFEGTADAVRKILWVIAPHPEENLLILSGDHLYRMDYSHFIQTHKDTGADITIAMIPVAESQASSFGLMKIDGTGKIIDFKEKPTGAALEFMKVDVQSIGFADASSWGTSYLASMGIYLFKRSIMEDLLERFPKQTDFGKHIIPEAIRLMKVQSYIFRGYWEDIGTIESFYSANLALVRHPNPSFTFFDEQLPIYSKPRFLPPSKIIDSKIDSSMISNGCIIRNSNISNSIIGIRARLCEKTRLENVLYMGADYFESDADRSKSAQAGIPAVGVGQNTVIRNAIVDKNTRIGKNVQITYRKKIENTDREQDGYCIRNGIVIIIKNSVIPDGTII